MEVNVQVIRGNWDVGYSLDKHTVSSTPIGPNAQGHMQFDTVRTGIGEALFLLKYRSDYPKIPIIAAQLVASLSGKFPEVSVVIPMPPSRIRNVQPVVEIARQYAQLVPTNFQGNLLVKNQSTPPMKDIGSREEKVAALMNAFAINDVLGNGLHNVLLIDDLYDSGASLEAATRVLRSYAKVGRIYVATVTRKH